MSASSGSSSLFTTMAIFIAAAAGAAYGIQNKDQVRKVVHDLTGIELVIPIPGPGPANAAKIDTADADRSRAAYGDVTLRAGRGGHFEARADINGRSIDVMVDTGATAVAMTYEDAERAGIYLSRSDFTHTVSTANGTGRVAPVTIGAISIGNITVRNVRGVVAERGKLDRTLLGMTFLGQLSRVEMRGRELVLHE